MLKKALFLIILFFLIINRTSNIFYFENNNLKNSKKIIENYIEIPNINLKKEFFVDTIKFKNQKNIRMYSEFGRPNLENSNTIIGAHSGTSKYSYFKNLYKIKQNSYIFINYENTIYKYIVYDVFYVDENDLKILNTSGKSMLTLITCKNFNRSKRLIILAELL